MVLTCERKWAGLGEVRMACFRENAVMNWWIIESFEIRRRADWHKCTSNSEKLILPWIWRRQDLFSYRYLNTDLQFTISQRMESTSAKLRVILLLYYVKMPNFQREIPPLKSAYPERCMFLESFLDQTTGTVIQSYLNVHLYNSSAVSDSAIRPGLETLIFRTCE